MSVSRRSLVQPAARWLAGLATASLAAVSLAAACPHAALANAPMPPSGPQELGGGVPGAVQAVANVPRRGPPYIAAVAAELMNETSGRELWGRETQVSRPIASITKVMTALIVIKAANLGRYITITQAEVNYVYDYGTSSAGLYAGDVLTARQLLYAMLLPSGADAAMALAISYGPGWHAFVGKMNATARALHLAGTHFTNFDGLPSSDVSTPRNLLVLGEAAMQLTAFRDVVRERSHWLPAGRLHHSYLWQNTNLLLGSYAGLIGIKTGWTPAAGECLLFEAVHGKRTLIGVVLFSAPTKSGQTFIDAARLLNWGFEPDT